MGIDGGANGAGQGQGQVAGADPCLRVPTEEELQRLYGAEVIMITVIK